MLPLCSLPSVQLVCWNYCKFIPSNPFLSRLTFADSPYFLFQKKLLFSLTSRMLIAYNKEQSKQSIVCLPVFFRRFLQILWPNVWGLYWFRRGLRSWGSHPQTPELRINRETKYKRRRTVRVSSLIAARQPWCTHTSGIWCRLCEKPCRVSFAPADVSWSY